MNLPSKELLSEVLNEDNSVIGEYTNISLIGNIITITIELDGLQKEKQINIYELEHKCKEWVFDSVGWMIYERKTVVGTYDYTALHKDGRISPNYNCIFTLCQWILEQK